MSDRIAQPKPSARYIAKGPRADENADDDGLWFLVDTRNGMPIADDKGIAWFNRADAKALATAKNGVGRQEMLAAR